MFNKKQPNPINNDNPPIIDSVINDFIDRKEYGYQIYKSYLQADNGRNNLIDLYQELMDAAVYIKAEIMENWKEPNELW